jgi:RNA polymerase sigma-70 factor (ECF subfamily)
VEQRESVSIAMLTLMERLSAKERVVYVLREAFGYSHGEIAEALDLTEPNCQQIHRRAKQHLVADRRRVPVDAVAARKIVEEFLAAALSGRTDSLVKLLADDATSIGDGGGAVLSLPRPITGALRVARFLRTLFTPSEAKWEMVGGRPDLYAAVANGVPALVMVVGRPRPGEPRQARTGDAPVGHRRARGATRRNLVTQVTSNFCQVSRPCPVQGAHTDRTGARP